jgi:DNA-directed RNA polymerase specialized sigma24 family protein
MGSRTVPAPPPETEGLQLYHALSQAVATSTFDFARAYLPHLAAWLEVNCAPVSPDLCEEAASETIYSLLAKPERFDPGQGPKLLTYLHFSARGDLRNRLNSERRHAHEPFDEKNVELGAQARKWKQTDVEPLDLLCDREDEQRRWALLQELRAMLPGPEQQVLDLLLEGERDTCIFAAALQLEHLPPQEQETEVKRVKDRIKKRIARWKHRS